MQFEPGNNEKDDFDNDKQDEIRERARSKQKYKERVADETGDELGAGEVSRETENGITKTGDDKLMILIGSSSLS